MITLTVISVNGSPSDSSLSASFDEMGGTIGRADTNQLVLPDPDRSISRVHAQIAFRGGKFAVIDRGSNPILVNGKAAGSGGELPLAQGDTLQIGGYVLKASMSATGGRATPADPFADLLGPASGAGASASSRSAGLIDPLEAFGAAPAAPSRSSAPSAPPPSSGASFGGIPDDWDPFADDPAPASARPQDFAQALGRQGGSPSGNFGLDQGAAAPSALIPDMVSSGQENSLDMLFGLKAPSGADPLANSRLDAPMAQPNMAASHDPMASLRSAPKASAATASDAFSDLNQPFFAPPAIGTRTPPPVEDKLPPPPESTPARAGSAVMSWETPEGHGPVVIRSPGKPAAEEAEPVMHQEPVAAQKPAYDDYPPTGMARAPVIARAATPAPVDAAAATGIDADVGAARPSADSAALLDALRAGLAAPGLQIDALTPELMKLIGELLHESARGTVDLLVARAALKREVRAEATMIVARENNPMKFSPSAEVALQHMLSPPTRGFMPAAPAMRDAYDDLRAHQFGFIAGMRAALEGVLTRFDPAQLESRLTQRSVLQSLVPGSRKARMWEVFTEHYTQIRSEASDDFHSLFGKAFLKAYEEHIDQLKGSSS